MLERSEASQGGATSPFSQTPIAGYSGTLTAILASDWLMDSKFPVNLEKFKEKSVDLLRYGMEPVSKFKKYFRLKVIEIQ